MQSVDDEASRAPSGEHPLGHQERLLDTVHPSIKNRLLYRDWHNRERRLKRYDMQGARDDIALIASPLFPRDRSSSKSSERIVRSMRKLGSPVEKQGELNMLAPVLANIPPCGVTVKQTSKSTLGNCAARVPPRSAQSCGRTLADGL